MEHRISYLTEDLAKKILGNKNNATEYLRCLNIPEFSTLKNFQLQNEIWKFVVKYWDYEKSKNIIRDLFRKTEKFVRGKDSANSIQLLLTEWNKQQLGKVEWPCSQGAFDDFVQKINNQNISSLEKDEKVKLAAVKYRRLKELNTVRNDYLETLIFEKNENIVPTLNHRRGVDFFINGISFDQKVSKSPTNEFKRDFGEHWKNFAKQNPLKVAEYLYQYQDEGRFDASPRLYVVYLDEDIPVFELKNKIDSVNISQPQEISFSYKHKNTGLKQYKTLCFMILLSQ